MSHVLVLAQCLADNEETSIIFVEKLKPDWQKRKYNLVGGKIELNESPEEAAIREFKEKTGLQPYSEMVKIGEIHGSEGWLIHVFRCFILDKYQIKPTEGEKELVFWADWYTIKERENLIDNLKVIVPLGLSNVKNWKIIHDDPNNKSFRINLL